ncbi:hypothetical protein KCP71_16210 [Salmonella enterica subsp. enterica]|nr:hypothetical protein KCP71_16210 [Salmonella enterica subsp. enterica]
MNIARLPAYSSSAWSIKPPPALKLNAFTSRRRMRRQQITGIVPDWYRAAEIPIIAAVYAFRRPLPYTSVLIRSLNL